MKRFIVASALVLAAGVASADTVVWNQTTVLDSLAYFSDITHNNSYGIDQLLADNFTLAAATDIHGVDWYGQDTGGLASFTLQFFTSAGLVTGVPEYSETIGIGSVSTSAGRFGSDKHYSADFSSCVTLGEGEHWLSVGGPGGNVWFAWGTAVGDGQIAYDADFGTAGWQPGEIDFNDLAFQVRGCETVPLPPAAYAGMGTLAGLLGISKIRKRRLAAN